MVVIRHVSSAANIYHMSSVQSGSERINNYKVAKLGGIRVRVTLG